jgi:hypothetical protein
VFTSPPYINVFNYHQQCRASVEALGWKVLPLARSEIGSNRKNRGNRFLTVIQYCLEMTQTLCELSRVCKQGSRAIFVVGRESNVRKTPFWNGKILRALVSQCCGLETIMQQERVFTNRFGTAIYEDILHFELHQTDAAEALIKAREISKRVLCDARKRAPSESLCDLNEAIEKADTVAPSPFIAIQDQPKTFASSNGSNGGRRDK